MDIGRRIILALLTPLLVGMLFLLALDVGVTRTITHPKIVKGVLAKSGLYSSVVPNILREQGNIETVQGSIPTTDPLVQQAAAKTLTLSEVQAKSETAIDSIYAWLDGKTQQPDFNLSFTPNKATMASILAAETQSKLSSLPACTTPYTATAFDPLNATCLPPGISAVTAANALKDQINSADIDSATFKATDFKSNSSPDKTAFQDQFKDIPLRYQQLQKLPVILALLAILTAAAMVLLRRDWRSGLKHVGLLLAAVGIIMLFFALLFNSAIKSKAFSGVNTDNKVLQQNLKEAAKDLARNVNRDYVYFGMGYIVMGVITLAVPRLVKRTSAVDQPTNDAEPAAPNYKK